MDFCNLTSPNPLLKVRFHRAMCTQDLSIFKDRDSTTSLGNPRQDLPAHFYRTFPVSVEPSML